MHDQGTGLNSDKGKVYIVDDDPLVRSSLEHTLASAGYEPEKFATASHFLGCLTPSHVGCVLADYRMPGMDGMALQEELTRRNSPLSVIIITGYPEVSLAVKAIQSGAINFIEKPFDRKTLLDDVATAIAKSRQRAVGLRATKAFEERLAMLTDREREVAEQLVMGRTNRQIAEHLGLSPRTVEIHRAHVMEKLEVANLIDLARAVGNLH